MNLHINYKKYAAAAVVGCALLAGSAVFAQAMPLGDIPPELIPLAQDLGCDSKEACEAAFAADLSRGIELAEKHDIYDPATQKIANTFRTEVLANLTTAENFEEEFVKIAEAMIRQKPTLARLLNLEQQNITAARTIIDEVKGEGTSLNVCRQPAESLTKPELISCLNASQRLSRNTETLKNYIDEDKLGNAKQEVSNFQIQEALGRGEYKELGATSTDELGAICLRPGSPAACDEIARKFFGADGVQYLDQARREVLSIKEDYQRVADSFIMVTPDGRNITGENAIRDACDNAFNSHDVALARTCGEFAVKNGFVSKEEAAEGLSFFESVQDKNIDFNQCRKDPKACEQFIPQEQREYFNVMQDIEKVMTEEIGFSPKQCEQGLTNPEIGQKCAEGSKRALPRLEVLAQKYPEAQRIVREIRQHVSQNQNVENQRQELQQTFKNQAGPGGCNSPQGCFTYCSIPINGPECIAFGAKSQIFTGQQATDRFQEYSGHLKNAPAEFSGEGPFTGFKPQGPGAVPMPPGQQRGFTQPGPEFNQLPEFNNSQNGPTPECFTAIQSGDFAKAKELCAMNISQPTSPIDQNSQNQPQPMPYPQPEIVSCPAMPTVDSCPDGQEKTVSYSSPECGTYYSCRPKGDGNIVNDGSVGCNQAGGTWDSANFFCKMPGTNPMPPGGCPSGQRWDGNACVAGDYSTDPAVGCRQAGGAWDSEKNYCNMPGGTNCSSGQYWDYNTKTCVTSPSSSGQKQQTWNSFGLSSQIRADADSSRIESLKQACANVMSGANIWMPGAGDYSSPDFGMPSADKCQIASSCTGTQYFDGTSCVSNTATGSCGSGYWWDSATSSCKSNESTANTCPSGYYMGSNGTCVVSTTTACSSGEYWYTPPGGGTGYCQSMSTSCTQTGGTWVDNYCQMPTCPSGEYWYTPPGGGTGSCVSNTATGSCGSGYWWDSATSSCKSNESTANTTTAGSCSSGQYWNGSACVNTSTTDCVSGQYWDGSACVSNTTASPSTSCSSDQYWDGSACVSSTPPPSTSTTPTMDPGAGCAQAGGSWNGSMCQMPSSSPPPPTSFIPGFWALGSVFSALESILLTWDGLFR